MARKPYPNDLTETEWAILKPPALKAGFPRLSKLWADGTYAGTFVEQAQAICIDVEITTRLSDSPGFQVVPHRWVSERTFAWLGNYRRLSGSGEDHGQTKSMRWAG